MASLSKDGNGTSRIQFIAGDGERRAIRLGKVPAKVAETVLRRVESLAAHAIAGTAHDADLAAWLAAVPTVLYQRLVRAGLAASRIEDSAAPVVTLQELIEKFLRRAMGKAATRKVYAQCGASLRDYFGADAPLGRITAESADAWRAWLSEPHPIIVGRARKRVVKRLAVATQAKRLEVARQIFAKAVRWGMVERNPFEGVRGGSKVNVSRWRYVSREETAAIVEACPTAQWRAIVGLARYGGLRVPSELIGLRWCDLERRAVDGREVWSLRVRSPKTEHHGAGHAQRFVPVGEELLAVLEDCRRHAAPGETRIAPGVAGGSVNLRTELSRIVARAGLTMWEKPFQNLRSSCETDWLEMFPGRISAIAGWMGHSPTVAMRHYAQVLPQHFGGAAADVARPGDGAEPHHAFSPEKRAPLYGGARPQVKAAQNPAQQQPATVGKGRQAPEAETRVPREKQGLPETVQPGGSHEVGATRFEQPPILSGKTEIRVMGGAESGARPADREADPLLAVLVREWPRLTAEARLRIAEIAAAGGLGARVAPGCDSDGSPARPGKTKFRRRERIE